MSFKLWINTRTFPLIPVSAHLPSLSAPFDLIILILFLGILVLSCIFQKRFLIWVSLFLLLILLVQDQMRWQPWVYIYSLFLVPFSFKNSTSKKLTYTYFQLVLIGIYVWSGIHKLNMNFVDIVFPKLMLDAFNLYLIKYKLFGFGIPLLEIGIGIGFFFTKTRKLAFLLVVVMHLFILFSVHTKNDVSNSIIIPWNIAMIVFSYLCFYKNQEQIRLANLWKEQAGKFKTILMLLSLLLPILYFWGFWDHYLSYNLYSGKGKSFCVAVKDDAFYKLNLDFDNKACANIPKMGNKNVLNLNYWAFKELNVPIPPQKRVYKIIGEKICEINSSDNDLEFLIFDRPVTKGDLSVYSCNDLKW